MNSRRDFLKQAGMAAAGVVLLPALSAFKPTKRLGIQLWNFRAELPTDVKGIIPKIAKAGYQEVETYGYNLKDKFWGLDPKSFKSLLNDNGLTAPTGQYGMDKFIIDGSQDELKSYIEAANIVGTDYIIVPWMDPPVRGKTVDDWKRIADRLNEASRICKASGVKFGYHNHDFEFDKIGNTNGYEILLQNTSAKDVIFELDLYWTERSGVDPIGLFKAHPGRFPFWHVKDMDKANRLINTEVGSGSINYKRIIKGAKTAGLKRIVVEQENFSIDPFVSIKQSADYIRKTLL